MTSQTGRSVGSSELAGHTDTTLTTMELWQYDIPISFAGGVMTWDIWIELHGTVGSAALPYLRATNQRSSTLPSGNPASPSPASVGYELQVLKNWRNLTPEDNGDDWQFTFTGGDAPTDGTETISISDMTDRERTSCYVIGRFTWGAYGSIRRFS